MLMKLKKSRRTKYDGSIYADDTILLYETLWKNSLFRIQSFKCKDFLVSFVKELVKFLHHITRQQRIKFIRRNSAIMVVVQFGEPDWGSKTVHKTSQTIFSLAQMVQSLFNINFQIRIGIHRVEMQSTLEKNEFEKFWKSGIRRRFTLNSSGSKLKNVDLLVLSSFSNCSSMIGRNSSRSKVWLDLQGPPQLQQKTLQAPVEQHSHGCTSPPSSQAHFTSYKKDL